MAKIDLNGLSPEERKQRKAAGRKNRKANNCPN